MSTPTPHLLYDYFLDLFTQNRRKISQKTAIWHVPDPKYLTEPTTDGVQVDQDWYATTTNCFIRQYEDMGYHSITFDGLQKASSHLASTMLQQLRNERFSHAQLAQERKSDERLLIQDAVAQSQSVIAILMPPGIKRIITKIACMTLNLAYLPLDGQLSIGRIVELLKAVSPLMVITSLDYYQSIFVSPGSNSSPDFVQPFKSGRLGHLRSVLRTTCLKIFEELFDSLPRTNGYHSNGAVNGKSEPERTGNQMNLRLFDTVQDPVIVVLSTSGSTPGGPKLIRLRNSQLLNRLRWQWDSNATLLNNGDQAEWDMTCHGDRDNSEEVALASTACVFVDAFTELFGALFAGTTVVVPGGKACPSEVCVSDVRVISKLIQTFRITHLNTVPNQLKVWINQKGLIATNAANSMVDSLNTVVVSGDVLLPELACEFFRQIPGKKIRLLNLYGTTEIAGDVTAAVFNSMEDVKKSIKHGQLNSRTEPVMDVVPFITVGIPITHTAVFIVHKICPNYRKHQAECEAVNANGSLHPENLTNPSAIGTVNTKFDWKAIGYELCDKGCVGEVAVTGLALGESGIGLPVAENIEATTTTTEAASKVYFPGDLGFISPEDNRLYICGRSDELLKINGVGFLANEVDRLVSRIKEECVSNPEQLSETELKLAMVRESVTLPIQHPIQQEPQVVCFYMIRENCSPLLSPYCTLPEVSENLAVPTIIPSKPESPRHPDAHVPTPNDLAKVMAYYLPVYIRPVFIQVNVIPVMPTSGKVDKQLLRSMYLDFIAAKIATDQSDNGATFPIAQQPTDNNGSAERIPDPSNPMADDRERAREVLARILGMRYIDRALKNQRRPQDDEDFYFLGGNSLTAVLALENLRQLGFKVRLETFYQTGNIGQILDSVTNLESNGSTPCTEGIDFGIPLDVANQTPEPITVSEWDLESSSISREELIQLLVEEFWKRDPISHAFHLSWTDLELAASTYLKPNGKGTVLTATYKEFDSNQNQPTDVLVGVLLSVPSKHLPNLPETPALITLQHYFNVCGTVDRTASHSPEPLAETALTVIMVGVRTPGTDRRGSAGLHSTQAKWNRVRLEILTRLERHLLDVARANRFGAVETINTNEATKEVCLELGYVALKTTKMQSFASAEHLAIDRQFHEHQCHYMLKTLP